MGYSGYSPKLSKMRLFESAGHDQLHLLLGYLEDRVLDLDFYEFGDYWQSFIHDYLDERNIEAIAKILNKPIEDIEPLDYEELSVRGQQMFTAYVEDQGGFRYARYHEPMNCPSWFYLKPLSKSVLPNSTWLVHFTDHQNSILRLGFTHGAPDYKRLGLTIAANMFGGMTRSDTTEAGYNFAYTLDEDIDRRAEMAISGQYYGSNAVLFQAPCVKVHHNGDNENQAIFWGEDVKPSQIIPLTYTDHGWCTASKKGCQESLLGLITSLISGR